ncbi:MAG TPA: SDR family NAD(P)-dependent oxidoreductase [Solirubrobacteraceae bacterium]|jgi:NAD(P)-dependent dehydrogenase (short-subunit alcohol dehydrogenase family)
MAGGSETWVITGAASGIGRAVARSAHANGARVIAVDLDGAGLETLARELQGITTVVANVSLPEDADRVLDAAPDGVNVLVNNAAIMDGMMLVDETPDDFWQRVVAVNLTGPFLLSKRVLPGMIERGAGVIVNVSSIAGLRGAFAGAAYTASKHGVVGLTKSMAYTYREDGVRAVCVCPGATAHGSKGAIEEGSSFSERGFMRVTGGQLPTVIGHPEDVASVIMFAASDAGVRLNGAVLTADDGLVL